MKKIMIYVNTITILFFLFSCTMANPFSPTQFDFSRPQIEILGVQNNQTYYSVTIGVLYEDGVDYSFSIDNKPYELYSLFTENGTHHFRVKAIKRSNGMEAERNVQFKIARNVEILSISPKNGSVNVNPDTQMVIIFNQFLSSGLTGTITLNENGTPVTYQNGINADIMISGFNIKLRPHSQFKSASNYDSIKISGFKTQNGFDVNITDSNYSFTTTGGQFVQLLSPNGGEILNAGEIVPVNWNVSFAGNVRIHLYKDGMFYSSVSESAPSQFPYQWLLPANIPGGTGYRIRIESVANAQVKDDSDQTFSINGPFIRIDSPNVNEIFYMGTPNDILWTSNIPANEKVKIELCRDGMTQTHLISAETFNDGQHIWTIDESIFQNGFTPGKNYRVKITSISNPALFDYSDDWFEMLLAPNIYLLLDNSGSMVNMSENKWAILKNALDGVSGRITRNFNVGASVFSGDGCMEILDLKTGWSETEFKNSYSGVIPDQMTPTGESLAQIRKDKKFNLALDPYSSGRRKCIVVITDGAPSPYILTLQESLKLYAEGIPVYYLGFSGNASYETQLQEMALYGGTDNPNDASLNWYPINQASEIENALDDILFGKWSFDNTNVRKLKIQCTPDSVNGTPNAVFFVGNDKILGASGSWPAGYSNAYRAEYDSAENCWYGYILNQGNFEWKAIQSELYNNKINLGTVIEEKDPRHNQSVLFPAFNGWKTNSNLKVWYTPAPPVKNQAMTIYYDPVKFTNTTVTRIQLHWGKNSWGGGGQSIGEPDMTWDTLEGVWKITITVPSDAADVDFVFKINNGSLWDSNGGSDWKIPTL